MYIGEGGKWAEQINRVWILRGVEGGVFMVERRALEGGGLDSKGAEMTWMDEGWGWEGMYVEDT